MIAIPAIQIPGVYHRRLGDMVVTALSDGYVDMGYDIFRNIPEEETRGILARAHRISPPRISINAFALRTGDRTVLIDCGSQDLMGPTCGRLPDNLAVAGIDPASVDAVLLTHVHPDHSNGLTDVPTGRRLFPNAEVVVHENEVSHWFDDAAMARADERRKLRYFKAGRDQLTPYLGDRLKPFRDGDEVFPGVTAVTCAGHTPGHSAFVISSGSETMIIWGDTVHVPEIQIARPSVTMQFDLDPEAGAASRKRIFDMVCGEQMVVGGMHVHFPGFAHMHRDGEGYALVNEQWSFTI